MRDEAGQRARRRQQVFWMAGAWAVVIFATSCTFISRRVFINFVGRVVPQGVPQHLWVGFWNVFGLGVVKAYHMAEYALLCVLLWRAQRAFGREARTGLIWSAALSVLFAISDEWHQTFVPGRGGTWVDVLIDSAGIGGAVLVVSRGLKRISKLP